MTRNELTQIGGEYQNVAMNGDVKDWDVGASRWTKGSHDRLYFNDAKFVEYVDLDSLLVDVAGGAVHATADIEGDELVVNASVHGGDKEMTAVFQLPEGLAEETVEPREMDDDLESCLSERTAEPVTDGGEDVSQEFSDDEIATAIDGNAAETTVEEVRDVLAAVQVSVGQVWDVHMDAVEDNAMELVSMDGDTLVFADHTGQFWNAEFDNGPIGERDLGHGVQGVVSQLHHTWARRHTDYDWSVDDPVVVRKPAGFDAGQRLVEAVMLNLTSRGLTPRQAWSFWGVIAGNSRNNWAARMGYDSHSGVSNAVREAKQKVPLGYLDDR